MAPLARAARVDRYLAGLLRTLALGAAVIVLLIFLYLLREAWPALESVGLLRFLLDEGWHPTGGSAGPQYDIVPMLVGSLATTVGAMVLCAPLGILSGAFCRLYAPERLRRPYRRLIELLAGIPSVVYGFWGLVSLAPLVREIQPPGTSLLAGILVLTLMIVPTVALLSEAAFRNVPRSHLQAAAALGLSRWAILRGVLLPAARSGIGAALVLGYTRAIGETMAVLMVCGNVPELPGSLFAPVRTLTANIALELGYSDDAHRSALFVTGLVLLLIVAGLVRVSRRLGMETRLG